MPELIENKTTYSLSEITASIKSTLTGTYPESCWIIAELAKLNYYPYSGHCYPELVEKQNNVVKAQMRATIWADHYTYISKRFLDTVKEPLAEGMKVLLLVTITFHDIYGLSLNISDIEPAYSLGEMAMEKRDTIDNLKREGLFEKNKKLVMPVLPKRIAVISVRTSKGYNDLIATLANNGRGYIFHHMLFPAILQGDKAVGSIRAQLKTIKRFAAYFDAVAIIRGGGDDIGLSCYDNFALAKEVALFPLPVITGIGHSTNETVVEMIAHTNKITPTDVGYYLIQKFYDFESHIIQMQEIIIDFAKNEVLSAKNELKEEINLFNSSSSRILINLRQDLDNVVHMLHRDTRNRLFACIARISQTASAVRYGALNIVSDLRHNIYTCETKIRLLDPVTILKRGYSITFYKDQPLTDAGLLRKDDTILTKLYSGTLLSKVESTDTNYGKEDNIH